MRLNAQLFPITNLVLRVKESDKAARHSLIASMQMKNNFCVPLNLSTQQTRQLRLETDQAELKAME